MESYDNLAPGVQKLFDRVHRSHLAAMGTSEKVKHARDQVTRIKVDYRNNCLNVHYANGEWYRYFTNGSWG